MSINCKNKHKRGFSLFELLMTVAILGVMGSVAISAFGETSSSIGNTRDRRNAQEIANVCTAAHAAGLDLVVGVPLEAAVRRVIQGAAPTSGVFKDRVFKVNLIDETDIVGAMRFLEIQNGELLFRHDS